MPPSDADVVAQVLGGDVEAFRHLVARYRAGLLRYAVRMLGNRADAEDAVQDTFVRAYRSLAAYDATRRADSWLWSILVNRCRTAGAKRQRRERLEVDANDSLLDSNGTSDGGIAHEEPRPELRWALDRIPAQLREALLLKYLDDRTYEEMAVLTGASVSALKMRVKRARAQLEGLLREVYDD